MSSATDKGSNFVEDFVKHSMYNKVDTMEYYDEIQETREYQSLPEIRKIIDNNFQDFCVNNGLWNRVDLKEFISSDENKMLWGLWYVEAQQLKNRYRQHILNYYFKNLDKQVKDVQLENIKDFNPSDYYSRQPPIFKDIPKVEVKIPEDYKIKPSDLELIPYTTEFIRIGKSIQFNVEGFPQNQTLYLLMGMCIVDILKKGINNFKNFKELINHIKAYVQLNLKSICLDTLELPDKEDQSQSFYNLVTYLTFENKINEKPMVLIFSFSSCAMWSGLERIAKSPACTIGCKVFTLPSRHSGKPVRSLMPITGSPAFCNAFAVPPVEIIS